MREDALAETLRQQHFGSDDKLIKDPQKRKESDQNQFGRKFRLFGLGLYFDLCKIRLKASV